MILKRVSKRKELNFWTTRVSVLENIPHPTPASKSISTWYKNLAKSYNAGKNKININEDGSTDTGVKSCVSYLDAMTFGYTINLHCDIQVEIKEDGTQVLSWTSGFRPLSPRSFEVASQIPNVPGFGYFTQAWELPYAFTVPKGYSVLVTQPINRPELNTFVTSGVIDADDLIGPGGAPFAIKEGFSGIIEQGTPIMQIIPFKRDSWTSKVIESPFPNGDFISRNKITGWYKKNIWKKKSFH
jgi:hypothetical protein